MCIAENELHVRRSDKVVEFAVFVPLMFLLGVTTFYNNDIWFILATGREVFENGIPFTNPFALHEGLRVVVQQWGLAVELYLVFRLFGMAGVAVQTGVAFCVFGLLFRKAASLFVSNGNRLIALAVIPCTALLVAARYFSMRPILYSAIMLLIVYLVLERYKRTGSTLTLAILPVIVIVHVNMHASFWLFDVVLAALYLLSVPKNSVFDYYAYRKAPLVIAILLMILASLVNPYVLDGSLYVLRSYGIASEFGIVELQSPQLWSVSGLIIVLLLALTMFVLGRGASYSIDMQLTCLTAGALLLEVKNGRNGWFFIAAASLLMLALSRNLAHRIKPKQSLSQGRTILSASFVAVWGGCALCAAMYLHNGFEVEDGVDTPVKAIETLSSEVSSDAKGGVSLFNGFNNGGFFEWYGYRVIMDPRPELWAPSITSSEVDYAREYVSYMDRELAASDIVDEYDFDYILTRDN